MTIIFANLIILIKSIMNKKLFSWKALAGLALLVAMGLTSCKQSTEVDPTDPSGQTTPTKPSSTTTGDADVTFTVLKTTDLADLWTNLDATTKTALMKKTELTVQVNVSNYKLDGTTLTLPAFFNTTANSVLNLIFNGNFADISSALVIDADTNLSGAEVNIMIPGQDITMTLTAANEKSSIASSGTANINLTATSSTKKNALQIRNGVTVNELTMNSGDIVQEGGEIKALVITSAPTLVSKLGYAVGDNGLTNVKSLVVAADATVTSDANTQLGTIYVNDGITLTLGYEESKIEAIVGRKNSSGSVTAMVAFSADNADNLVNIGFVENIIFPATTTALNLESDKFLYTEFQGEVNITSNYTFGDVTFDDDVVVSISNDDTKLIFNNVNFTLANGLDVTGAKTVETSVTKTTYQWDIENNYWVEVTSSAPLTAANKKDSGVEIASGNVTLTANGSGYDLTDSNNLVGKHTVFTIVTSNTVTIYPKNVTVELDGSCKYQGSAITGSTITDIFTAYYTEPWFKVIFNGVPYSWEMSSTYQYVLIKQ